MQLATGTVVNGKVVVEGLDLPASGCHTPGLWVKACSNFVRAGNPAPAERSTVFLVGKRVVIVHAFVKKTQQTPDKELKLARKRAKEILDG